MKAIVNAKVISQGRVYDDHALVFDAKIRAICPLDDFAPSDGCEIIEADGLWAAPGLIDIHVHGGAGHDTMDASLDGLQALSFSLAQCGVTSFLPTTMTAPWAQLEQVLSTVHIGMQMSSARKVASSRVAPWGARVLGVHLEGPFIAEAYKGAHRAADLRAPDFSLLHKYLDIIRIVTFAPELPGSDTFLAWLQAHPHIVPAIGHSGASFSLAETAIRQGVRHATHIFNAMSPLHHREPGVVGAILCNDLSAELIADNLHVHPSLYQLLLKTLGPERLILISDGMRATGLTDGTYDLGGQLVHVQNGAARLADGTLAGSVLTLDQAVANFNQATACGLPTAISLASYNPARLLGLEGCLGDLQLGLDADIILIDENCRVQQTFIEGQRVLPH
ncbi:MAG: N-acetylglucosamine-6-phosphate deacetylase [Firmicutes bacterium]|nr:N-acetylglucosamine-6-phosphate deacetylase [Bacillota bacterium]